MAKDINKKQFTEETELKLDIFRECFREWYPVFVNAPFIQRIYIYDMFAGSGYDQIGNPGSPLILLEEAKGDKGQYCKNMLNGNYPHVYFAFNEKKKNKVEELKTNVSKKLATCNLTCKYEKCVFQENKNLFFRNDDFKNLITNTNLLNILNNNNYAKFILLDQYGFIQISDDIFKQLVNAPKTDFIFFIASSFLRRFSSLGLVKKYFQDHSIEFDTDKPQDCHRNVAKYFRSLVPCDKEYYIHHFTIKKNSNYYGLIFGTNHTLGMEKFLKVCWKHDRFAGESNFNINYDFEEGSLFFEPNAPNKIKNAKDEISKMILRGVILSNKEGLKYTLKLGCDPKIFVEVAQSMINKGEISIDGKFNKQSANIHKINEYKIILINENN
jgi:three-Cys-motif partner protein